jgi:hypothetical protein
MSVISEQLLMMTRTGSERSRIQIRGERSAVAPASIAARSNQEQSYKRCSFHHLHSRISRHALDPTGSHCITVQAVLSRLDNTQLSRVSEACQRKWSVIEAMGATTMFGRLLKKKNTPYRQTRAGITCTKPRSRAMLRTITLEAAQ